MVRTYVDCEGPVRNWARTESHLAAVSGGRAWFGTPKGAVPTQPWMTLFLVDGTPDPNGQMPLIPALIQFDCWAPTKTQAGALLAALVTAAESLVPGTLLDSTLRCWTAHVTRAQWFPDPANDMPRYSADVRFLVCATGA